MFKLDRPSWLPFTIQGQTFPAYQNSNAEKSRLINDHKKNFQKVDPCFSAGGAQLFVKGIVSLPISILGRKTMHPFRIITGLNE
jgi:hypothetical protein